VVVGLVEPPCCNLCACLLTCLGHGWLACGACHRLACAVCHRLACGVCHSLWHHVCVCVPKMCVHGVMCVYGFMCVYGMYGRCQDGALEC